ncbi:antiviral innate immune response receptor RIG-I isoform X2 [Cygnus atratus]|uniref:antiviral innate immune response receptor RIG-I isoform X2 n=1 Tax=Cygnus atratus TaxID=8868 RepID=UPI0021B80C13|nr:antiviral innate immune response receptor RIG-I isoform X2 [Cygnus atratus]
MRFTKLQAAGCARSWPEGGLRMEGGPRGHFRFPFPAGPRCLLCAGPGGGWRVRAMTAEEKRGLQCYRRYIERSLNPVYVLGNMADWLPDELRERIRKEEERGVSGAAALFLDAVLQLEARGWFRGMLDAMLAAGYTGLAAAIENWDFSKLEKLELHRQLLKRIEATMLEVDPVVLIPYINTCLIDRECEEIQQISESRSKAAGITKLIECLCRSDKEHWPKSLQLALDNTGYYRASELWDMREDNAKDVDSEMTDASEDCLETSMTYSEEAEPDDNLSENLGSDAGIGKPPPVYEAKKARSYQIELAQPAINGKNTLICAPTGSGKTFVALLICEHHFQNMPAGRKGKVVFLATKVPVYEQQKNVFKQHFERQGYSIQGVSGENFSNVSVENVIEDNDIIILTPQILVNSFEDGTLTSLSVFTLMIFDECHNTTGNHPYNVLMTRYLEQKFNSSASQLPQILGLTASVGVGNAKNIEETIEHICSLCSYLDIQAISTVRENIQDLQRFMNKPEIDVRLVKRRVHNHFAVIISDLMSETEALMRKIYSVDTVSQNSRKDFGTQKYEHWIVVTQRKCRLLQLEDKEEESRICRALFICTEHLRKYNDALIISEDARIIDALSYLTEFFTNVKNGPYTELEQHLTAKFQEKEPELTALSKDETNENPKLEELACILDDAYRYNPQTRTLLFAKTRALVAALKKCMEENPILSYIKPDVLMGRGRRDQKAGMTLPSQKGVLDAFKTSKDSRLLIATSVADEGIDIAQCNLVVLYEYSGNVTKMIQVRGRGRAAGSKCILVTSKTEVVENEKCNRYKEEMMNKAIEKLQEWDEETFAKKIHNLQMKEKVLRDSRKKEIKPKVVEGQKNLLCGKCKAYACSTDDIRIIKESHHIVLGEAFKERYITKPHKKPMQFDGFEKKSKMHCRNNNCQHDWGITVKYLTFDNLPVIKIKSFVVQSAATGTQMDFQKWKSINSSLKNFDVEEMSNLYPPF